MGTPTLDGGRLRSRHTLLTGLPARDVAGSRGMSQRKRGLMTRQAKPRPSCLLLPGKPFH
jgi:hypothetical protein